MPETEPVAENAWATELRLNDAVQLQYAARQRAYRDLQIAQADYQRAVENHERAWYLRELFLRQQARAATLSQNPSPDTEEHST